MGRVGAPVPAEPRRKLESFALTSASGGGYTTRMLRGPRTRGTAGSELAVDVSLPGEAGRLSRVGAEVGGELERAQAASPASRISAPCRQLETMAARYLVT